MKTQFCGNSTVITICKRGVTAFPQNLNLHKPNLYSPKVRMGGQFRGTSLNIDFLIEVVSDYSTGDHKLLHIRRSKACSSESPDADGSFTFLHEPEDDMKCVICLSVAEDPLQHEECGKLFCNKCIEKHGKDKPCPHCKTGGQFYKDKKSKFKCKLCSHRSSTHSESEKSCKTFWISEG